MSADETPVELLLSQVHRCRRSISSAFYNGRIERTDQNKGEIELLRQRRLLSPDTRDEFQMRASLRQFLGSVINTDRVLLAGADIGANFDRLLYLLDGHAEAYLNARVEACERLESDIRESVSDIACAIEDELVGLQSSVSNKFAAVQSLSEKKQQNLYFLRRTQRLVNLLENFHFSDIGHQLQGHEALHSMFRALLSDRVPAFRQALHDILALLNQYLFEFRQIEDRARRVREVWLFMNRNPDWAPRPWDEATDLPAWLNVAEPIPATPHPDVSAPENEELLAEIACTIPADTTPARARPPGDIDTDAGEIPKTVSISPVARAIKRYFRDVMQSDSGLSARQWWAENPSIVGAMRQDIWLLRVMTEEDKKGRRAPWALRLVSKRDPHFTGNHQVHDVIAQKRSA